MRYLLGLNPGVKIYVANDEYFGGPTPSAFFNDSVATLPRRMRYFDGRIPDPLPHGSPWKHANTERVTGRLRITPTIGVVANISRSGRFTETPELSLVIDTPDGQILVVGCSHPGIEQILESVDAKRQPVRLIIGGLHWVSLPAGEVERLVRALDGEWNVAGVAPGHCTGEPGFAALGRVYGRRYIYAGLGTIIDI